MPDNPLKRLRAEIEKTVSPERVEKANRTLYLNRPQFETFRRYCESKGVKPSEIVDKLIAMLLEEVQDELV